MTNRKLRNRRNIALKMEGKKKKKKLLKHGVFVYLVTHPSTNPTEQSLTSLSGRHMFLSERVCIFQVQWLTAPLIVHVKKGERIRLLTFPTGHCKN